MNNRTKLTVGEIQPRWHLKKQKATYVFWSEITKSKTPCQLSLERQLSPWNTLGWFYKSGWVRDQSRYSSMNECYENNILQSSHAAVPLKSWIKKIFQRGNVFACFLVMHVIQHCFICRPSHLTVSEDAGIEPRTVVTLTLTARHSNHLDRSQSQTKFRTLRQLFSLCTVQIESVRWTYKYNPYNRN